jgi:hypothetical protein
LRRGNRGGEGGADARDQAVREKGERESAARAGRKSGADRRARAGSEGKERGRSGALAGCWAEPAHAEKKRREGKGDGLPGKRAGLRGRFGLDSPSFASSFLFSLLNLFKQTI